MKTIRVLFPILLLLVCLVIPTSSSAQTRVSDDVYRMYLLQIIALLEQQIAALSTISYVGTNEPEGFTSFLLETESDVVARYAIVEGVETISNSLHEAYIERFLALTPDQFDSSVKEAVIFAGGYTFDAFVETIPPYRDDTWRFGLHEDMFEFSVDSTTMTELFIHEFAHIGSYAPIEGEATSAQLTCHTYFDEMGCPPQNSYLHAFIETFWSKDQLDTLARDGTLTEVYTSRELNRNFVSDYAATAPSEDFAESFVQFILTDLVVGSTKRDEKIRFFSRYPELLSWRVSILQAQ